MFHVEVDILWAVMSGCVATLVVVCGLMLRLALHDWMQAHPARRRVTSRAAHRHIIHPF
jgi:hypothetical protein